MCTLIKQLNPCWELLLKNMDMGKLSKFYIKCFVGQRNYKQQNIENKNSIQIQIVFKSNLTPDLKFKALPLRYK